MALGQRLEIRQGQSLVMTPQLQQAIKLLQLSNIELAEYCESELEKNPLLERDESRPREAERDIVEREIARAKNSAKDRSAEREHLKLWIANDQCPPSPGCTLTHPLLNAASSGSMSNSIVAWQYAQSPRRAQFTAACPANYAQDGKCYAPGLPQGANSFVDLNVADSADPSEAP